jgi:hypothetical protein
MNFFEQRESTQQSSNQNREMRSENSEQSGGQYNQNYNSGERQPYNNSGNNSGGGYQGGQGGYQKKPYTPGGGYQKQGGYQGGQGGGFKNRPPAEQEDPYLYLPYAATGNKDMPESFKPMIQRIGRNLQEAGLILRTGGMEGLEDVIEKSATKLEVHLPFKDFDGKQSKFTYTSDFVKGIAKMFHTSFDTLKPVVQTFLAKNVRLVLGKDGKSPALFLLVWTEDGAETTAEKTFKTGNSGNAIEIANAIKIPVFNLARPDAEQRIYEFVAAKTNKEIQR